VDWDWQGSARTIYRNIQVQGGRLKNEGFLPAYALAVAEENAVGSVIATAPPAVRRGYFRR